MDACFLTEEAPRNSFNISVAVTVAVVLLMGFHSNLLKKSLLQKPRVLVLVGIAAGPYRFGWLLGLSFWTALLLGAVVTPADLIYGLNAASLTRLYARQHTPSPQETRHVEEAGGNGRPLEFHSRWITRNR